MKIEAETTVTITLAIEELQQLAHIFLLVSTSDLNESDMNLVKQIREIAFK